jgi:hypothetical protein
LSLQSFEVQGREQQERWQQLCEQASTEQDPVKLIKLITEINTLLLNKEQRLLTQEPSEQKVNGKH